MILRRALEVGLAGILSLTSCAYIPRTQPWPHETRTSELECKLLENYLGVHDYDVKMPIYGKSGEARFRIEKKISGKRDYFEIGFDVYLSGLARIGGMRELHQQTIAYFEDGKMHPIEFVVELKKKSSKKNDTFRYHPNEVFHNNNQVEAQIKTIDPKTKEESYTNVEMFDPLSMIVNLLDTSFEEMKKKLVEDELSLGYACGRNSPVEIKATYDNRKKSITIHFTEEVMEGGGDFVFFYRRGMITTDTIVMDQLIDAALEKK